MSLGRIAGRLAVAALGVSVFVAATAAPSWAAGGTKLCVPNKEGAGLVTPKHGKCKKGYKLTTLGAEGKQGAAGKPGPEGKQGPEGKLGPEGRAGFTPEQAEQLKALLPYVRFVGTGVAGKPTVQFSGVNVQIVNGEGQTESTNGAGNLVIGYDENPGGHKQTGSHDLILGEEQEFTSVAGIVAGFENAISAPFASVSGGERNTASGEFASVSGGELNTASGEWGSVSGGELNKATGEGASVSGGAKNTASAFDASVSGGKEAKAGGAFSWIGGGAQNEIINKELPGEEGGYASIFGGKQLKTATDFSAIP
jgi:hypothetical protein